MGRAAIVVHYPQPGDNPLNRWNEPLDSDGPPFDLDLDNNGTNDFRLNRDYFGASFRTLEGNRVISTVVTDSGGNPGGWISPVQEGSILGSAPVTDKGGWNASGDVFGGAYILGVKFEGMPDFGDPETIARLAEDYIGMQLSDAYIGVEFEAEDGIHYGWIRFTGFPLMAFPILNEDGTFSGDYLRGLNQPGGYIHSWAWETEPGKAIVAGAVPEPGSSILGGIAALGLLAKRRRG